jgi:L-aminopeptidase/D-esterase-like protein
LVDNHQKSTPSGRKMENSITDIPGIQVGHAQNYEALTGCTVILCKNGAIGGVDQRGGAPGTRETDPLHPMHLVEKVHAILLSGGSAFGLDAATGVVRFLEERGVGFDVGVARVPIVPAAILFDLGIGRSDIRPNASMGYQACLNASSDPPKQGNVGAGTGATVGKILGIQSAMKAGIGTASLEVAGGLLVGAIVAVNSWGDVINPKNGNIVAGARILKKDISNIADPPFVNTMNVMRAMPLLMKEDFHGRKNTVIGVICTNARLNKEEINKVAQMAHDGLARTIRPAHTMFDGDTIFALGTGELDANVNTVGSFAAEVFAEAVLQAVYSAKPAAGLPATSSLGISE